MTTPAHKRQPDLLRARLLAETARLIAEAGLQAVSTRAVSEAAGITKGGLFHHFASKQALIEAVFAQELGKFDAQVDALMAADAVAPGRFTRAYIRAVLGEMDKPLIHLSVATMTDAGLRRIWFDWMTTRRERHAATDSAPGLALLRYAADGAWTAGLWPGEYRTELATADTLDRLIAQTYEAETP